eukprot:530518_1
MIHKYVEMILIQHKHNKVIIIQYIKIIFLLTSSLIGSNYSNASNLTFAISKSNDEYVTVSPFNPNAVRPPELGAEGLDMLYKHLRGHFTSLAVEVDCNQVSYTFKIQEMDEELAIT